MKRLPTFLLFLLLLTLVGFLTGGIGAKATCLNDKCQVAAAASIAGLVCVSLIAALPYLLPRIPVEAAQVRRVGILRRLAALYVDMFASWLPLSPFLTLAFLIVEASNTGNFQWTFSRDFERSSDKFLILGSALAMFGGLFAYHLLHLMHNRQTWGQYLLGYRLCEDREKRSMLWALKRLGWTLVTLSVWPIAVLVALSNKERHFWFDTMSDCTPHRVAYEGENAVLEQALECTPNRDRLQYGRRRN